ncbi:hypothetical protein CBM2634_B170390 [Cupriavidus taiwanensis]|uniref:Uncharacterized protein n=1 Tax=Cupriavidus taiwanensis TaxID=164546 RepID=A0A375JAS1_9BURK|nr:hypothetical protein CBM2634_B170390 [Cupriavidus taiwanensis]
MRHAVLRGGTRAGEAARADSRAAASSRSQEGEGSRNRQTAGRRAGHGTGPHCRALWQGHRLQGLDRAGQDPAEGCRSATLRRPARRDLAQRRGPQRRGGAPLVPLAAGLLALGIPCLPRLPATSPTRHASCHGEAERRSQNNAGMLMNKGTAMIWGMGDCKYFKGSVEHRGNPYTGHSLAAALLHGAAGLASRSVRARIAVAPGVQP